MKPESVITSRKREIHSRRKEVLCAEMTNPDRAAKVGVQVVAWEEAEWKAVV
jgi:hypothetical protein